VSGPCQRGLSVLVRWTAEQLSNRGHGLLRLVDVDGCKALLGKSPGSFAPAKIDGIAPAQKSVADLFRHKAITMIILEHDMILVRPNGIRFVTHPPTPSAEDVHLIPQLLLQIFGKADALTLIGRELLIAANDTDQLGLGWTGERSQIVEGQRSAMGLAVAHGVVPMLGLILLSDMSMR